MPTTAAAVYWVVTAVITAYSAYVSVEARKQAKRAAKKAENAGGATSQQMFKDPIAPQQIVLGQSKLSGPMFFAQEAAITGVNDAQGLVEALNIGVHIAGHVCEDVTDVWLDSHKLVPLPNNGIPGGIPKGVRYFTFPHGDFANNTYVAVYLGDHEAAPQVKDGNWWNSGETGWKDDMFGKGQCFAIMTVFSDKRYFQGGVPNPVFAVKGAKVFDPRTGKAEYSDNPALLIRHYRELLKKGTPDDTSYIQAANICDELVDIPGGQEKRYRCGYSFQASQKPREVLDILRRSCDAISLHVAGRHGMQVGAYYGPGTVELSVDDLIGDIKTTPSVRKRDRINAISATYREVDDDFNDMDMPRVVHTGYLKDDNDIINVKDLDLKCVPSVYQAQRLAMIEILTIRDAIAIEITCNLLATPLLPGAVFKLNFPENQWHGVEFAVKKWVRSSKGKLTLTASQTKPSHYSTDGAPTSSPQQVATLPIIDRSNVEPVTNLKYTTLVDSNTLQALVTWDYTAYAQTKYEVTFFKNNVEIRQDEVTMKEYRLADGFEAGQYQVQVVVINAMGARSPVALLAFSALVPQTPIGCHVDADNFSLKFTPVPASDTNFDTNYDFAVGFDDGATDSEIEATIDGRAKVLTAMQLKANTLYHCAIREVSRWGMSGWYKFTGKTTYNATDILEVIHGDLNGMLNNLQSESLDQIENRSNELNNRQDSRLQNLLSEIDSFHNVQSQEQSKLELNAKYNAASSLITVVQNALTDAVHALAEADKSLLAHFNSNSAAITDTNRAISTVSTAVTESEKSLIAQIESGDKDVESRANEYTRAAVGYCVDKDGNITTEDDAVACVAAGHSWIDGPLAENIRNLQVTNAAGHKASLSNLMQVFEDKDGKLLARGSMIVNNNGLITGIVNSNDGSTTALDVIAENFRVGMQDSAGKFHPRLFVDAVNKALTFSGHVILDDGQVIKTRDELKGDDGKDGEKTLYFFLKTATSVLPSVPTNHYPPSGWHSTVPSGDGFVFSVAITLDHNGAPQYPYSEVIQMTGSAGTDGINGTDGTVWGTIKLRDGVFPSDALATADFKSRYKRNPILDDLLTYVSDDGKASSAKSFDGTHWVTPTLQINGNIITPGTMYGNAFVAGSEIKSPVIDGGAIYGATNFGGSLVTDTEGVLALSEYNQDKYGTMDLKAILAAGHKPYYGRLILPASALGFAGGTVNNSGHIAAGGKEDFVFHSWRSPLSRYDDADTSNTVRLVRKTTPLFVKINFQVTLYATDLAWKDAGDGSNNGNSYLNFRFSIRVNDGRADEIWSVEKHPLTVRRTLSHFGYLQTTYHFDADHKFYFEGEALIAVDDYRGADNTITVTLENNLHFSHPWTNAREVTLTSTVSDRFQNFD